LTSDETLGKILQIESIIDQLAKTVQREQDTVTRLDAQKQALDLLLERAKTAQAEADRLAEEAKEGNPQIKACDDNISDWENHIIVLQSHIDDYKRRIAEEKAKRSKLQEDANSSIKPLIDEKGREGLKAYSASAAIFEEVKSLESAHHVLDKEIASLTKLNWESVKRL
jgi:chromosome segregation ATPase